MVFSLQSLCVIHCFKKNKYSLNKKMKVAAKYCILGENTPDIQGVNAPPRQEEYFTFLIRTPSYKGVLPTAASFATADW